MMLLILRHRDEWNLEEEVTLLEQYKEYGSKWTRITRYLPGRSETAVKNKFQSFYKRAALAMTSQEKMGDLAFKFSSDQVKVNPEWLDILLKQKKELLETTMQKKTQGSTDDGVMENAEDDNCDMSYLPYYPQQQKPCKNSSDNAKAIFEIEEYPVYEPAKENQESEYKE